MVSAHFSGSVRRRMIRTVLPNRRPRDAAHSWLRCTSRTPTIRAAATARLSRSNNRRPGLTLRNGSSAKPSSGAEKRAMKKVTAFIVVAASADSVERFHERNMATRSTMSLGAGANAAAVLADRSLMVHRYNPTPGRKIAKGAALSTCRATSSTSRTSGVHHGRRDRASQTAVASMRR
ncbi:hypothetical protein SDC9_163728 [bioreactor metagenome]|uniref:Uncharacterized protein n=1 Tax=bioreactor metagenome TaxID=1076179 RepID=A0A645FPP1_9ZZZZ